MRIMSTKTWEEATGDKPSLIFLMKIYYTNRQLELPRIRKHPCKFVLKRDKKKIMTTVMAPIIVVQVKMQIYY